MGPLLRVLLFVFLELESQYTKFERRGHVASRARQASRGSWRSPVSAAHAHAKLHDAETCVARGDWPWPKAKQGLQLVSKKHVDGRLAQAMWRQAGGKRSTPGLTPHNVIARRVGSRDPFM